MDVAFEQLHECINSEAEELTRRLQYAPPEELPIILERARELSNQMSKMVTRSLTQRR